MDFSRGLGGKESACRAGDLGLIAWLGKIPWRRGMATHSGILSRGMLWTRRLADSSPRGGKGSDTTEQLTLLSPGDSLSNSEH